MVVVQFVMQFGVGDQVCVSVYVGGQQGLVVCQFVDVFGFGCQFEFVVVCKIVVDGFFVYQLFYCIDVGIEGVIELVGLFCFQVL